MRCPHCGAIVASNDLVCPNCGSEICEIYTGSIPPVPEGEDIYDTTAAEPKRKHFLKETGEALFGKRTMRWSNFLVLLAASLFLFLLGWIPAVPEVSKIEVAAGNTDLILTTNSSVNVNFQIYPENVPQRSLGLEVSDSSVIKAEILSLTPGEGSSSLQVQITGLRNGSASLKVVSKNSSVQSSPVQVTVENPPKISAIDAFSPDTVSLKKNDTYQTSIYLAPGGLTSSDIVVETEDQKVASVENTVIEDAGEMTLLTLTIKGKSAGNTRIEVGAADGKTASEYLEVTVTERGFTFPSFWDLFSFGSKSEQTSSGQNLEEETGSDEWDSYDVADSYSGWGYGPSRSGDQTPSAFNLEQYR